MKKIFYNGICVNCAEDICSGVGGGGTKKVMRESRNPDKCSPVSCAQIQHNFYCTEEETASLSNSDYLAPVRLRLATFLLLLNVWSRDVVIIEMF